MSAHVDVNSGTTELAIYRILDDEGRDLCMRIEIMLHLVDKMTIPRSIDGEFQRLHFQMYQVLTGAQDVMKSLKAAVSEVSS